MTESNPRDARNAGWCLESLTDGGKSLQRVPIAHLPFRIGRIDGLDLTLPFHSVSKRHAEIYVEGNELKLRDLGSTNGTFVNRKRIQGSPLHEGDILHFAADVSALDTASVERADKSRRMVFELLAVIALSRMRAR